MTRAQRARCHRHPVVTCCSVCGREGAIPGFPFNQPAFPSFCTEHLPEGYVCQESGLTTPPSLICLRPDQAYLLERQRHYKALSLPDLQARNLAARDVLAKYPDLRAKWDPVIWERENRQIAAQGRALQPMAFARARNRKGGGR